MKNVRETKQKRSKEVKRGLELKAQKKNKEKAYVKNMLRNIVRSADVETLTFDEEEEYYA